MTITYLPCIYLKANMLCPCALMSYSLISVIHVCTMCTPWGTHISWCHFISRLFPVLLDPKSFQTVLDCSKPNDIMSCDFPVMCPSLSYCRLITILLLYLICSNPNPTKVCPHFHLIIDWSKFFNKLYYYFSLSNPINEATNILNNLYMKPSNKIST